MTTENLYKKYEVLFNLVNALPEYKDIDALLSFITKEILKLIYAEGAFILLIDEETNEFFFRTASYDDDIEKKVQTIRFPSDKGITGRVFKIGKPLIVNDVTKSSFFLKEVEEKAGFITRNMLAVPIDMQGRPIGVFVVINRKNGNFTRDDEELLVAAAGAVAYPIENIRINNALQESYDEVKKLNEVKDKVIHHLSHELKTPVAVLAASLELLKKRLDKLGDDDDCIRIFKRAHRNLQRILTMQYELEDIIRDKNYNAFHLLNNLLFACTDQLEIFITEEMGGGEIINRIRRRIDEIFGPRKSVPKKIKLNTFVSEALKVIGFRIIHREGRIIKNLQPVPFISIPEDVLMKIIEGLVKNALENTPNKGKIIIFVEKYENYVKFEVQDFGIGISDDNMKLMFATYFINYETMQYSTKREYDFGAGGKGFDLLRLKIFSEQYNFKIDMKSKQCPYIKKNKITCPGDIDKCEFCRLPSDCFETGGTTVTLLFPIAETPST
jgi:signal transduction histidine kinase